MPLLATALLCGAVVVLAPLVPGTPPFMRWPGFGALALCIGAALLLDDDAAVTVAASPTSLARRRLLRVGLALPLLGAVWAASLWYATSADGAWYGPSARAALSLQLAAMVALTLAASAVALRAMPGEQGGWSAAAMPLALLGLALALPPRVGLLVQPGDERWHGAQQRWAVLLAIGLVVLLWAGREPSRRRAVQAPPSADASCAGAP